MVSRYGLVADAAPDVFASPVVRYGGKTVRVLRLTDEALARISHVQEMASVRSPRFAMMIVPPRPWRYEETV